MRTILNVMCPEKQYKPIQAGDRLSWALSGPLALFHLESGHAVPFPPQDFCSLCAFVYCCRSTWILLAGIRIKKGLARSI